MSVFGGDSWVRESQYRKRRIGELVVENVDSSAYKKLSSGKFVCLVCSHRPVLDTPLMLSVHMKGSRHQAAQSRLRARELEKQGEINKRIALSESGTATSSTSTSSQLLKSANKPLIEHTRKTASNVLHKKIEQSTASQENRIQCSEDDTSQYVQMGFRTNQTVMCRAYDLERQERELKFTAAGWKRDGHGRWFKDENVEFDSDEEDPNLCLP